MRQTAKRRNSPFYVCLVFVGFCAFSELSAGDPESDLLLGIAVTDITPPPGYGQYRGAASGVHDPLHAKALVFRQGDEKGALVVSQIIGINRELSGHVRRLAAKETGIPFHNISMTASHTHTGPRYSRDFSQYVATHEITLEALKRDPVYPAQLMAKLVHTIVRAYGSTRPIRVDSGLAEAYGISFNRRFLMSNGRVRFNPGFQNPEIVRPMGPVDPEVNILAFREVDQDVPFASLVVFANHLDTVGGTDFSADYPYHLSEALRKEFGGDFISVFGTGTCGNLNHYDVTKPGPQRGHDVITAKIGRTLAQSFIDEVPMLQTQQPAFAVRMQVVFAPMQEPSAEEIAWAQNEDAEPLYPERPFLVARRRSKILSILEKRISGEAIPPSIQTEKWTLPLEVHVFRLSREAAVVTLPGEVFVELGLEIKRRSPFANTGVIELANCEISYVPTRDAFREGDYEVINSRVDPGGGEMLVGAAVKMLHKLKSELQ